MIPDQRLLVAAFGRVEHATAAWLAWSGERDLGALDPGELRLLPPVYHNLRAAGVDDAEIASIVKQMTRSMFVRTRLILHDAALTVALLDERGIDSMLLKGAALVAGGYCDARTRPMSDFDLLVRPADATAVASLLAEAGWRHSFDRTALATRHAALFEKQERCCDLHWWALWELRDAGADERFWRGAEGASIDGVKVRILRPEHQLLHVIVHGTRAFDTAVRWIGDALAVLRTRGEAFDWELFAREAEARNVAHPVGDALAYLNETFEASVPVDWIDALRSGDRSRLYAARPGDPQIGYVSALAHQSQRHGLLWFLRNLQYAWGVKRMWQLPLALVQRAFRRVFRRSDLYPP